jgi:hypothetical protein
MQIAKHIESVMRGLPHGVKIIYGRADSGFYCWEAVQAYEKYRCQFIVVARKTSRLLDLHPRENASANHPPETQATPWQLKLTSQPQRSSCE